jgi:hypothetical protein
MPDTPHQRADRALSPMMHQPLGVKHNAETCLRCRVQAAMVKEIEEAEQEYAGSLYDAAMNSIGNDNDRLRALLKRLVDAYDSAGDLMRNDYARDLMVVVNEAREELNDAR